MNNIELKKLWKEYGDNVVLENINLTVKAGEFITLVGASGCGKTTFLKMLLGTEKPSRGQLLLDGDPIRDEPDADRGIVFQRYSVFPHLNVIENVMLGVELGESRLLGRCFGSKRRKVRAQAQEMLELVGLGHVAKQYPTSLSGGMQQRLAIAQALIKQPKVLLLDEPFGALDPGIRSDMHALILDIWQKTGITIFMITHDLTEGFYLGTRLLVFDKHRIDPDNPNRYGASITFDIPVADTRKSTLDDISNTMKQKQETL
ncbi:ABC transporter ATP-binding protein [Methylophaga sulfidovorans]|uniref:NitT/TauT family transport system ATP-binding protein n=1 Tax=Methylophaga sulfidovorans TaxID=45496 RepID=A0A1I3VR42_9GAMM|nr:ABC transporter ATP-binding protein [Methylophaga sulfidovorans]SFJ97884.1 NitT/TauT family transport system ATP-binding protein [Methylophaga sulfidovorans]